MNTSETQQDTPYATQTSGDAQSPLCRLCHRARPLNEDQLCYQCEFLVSEYTERLYLTTPQPYRQRYAENMVWEPVF